MVGSGEAWRIFSPWNSARATGPRRGAKAHSLALPFFPAMTQYSGTARAFQPREGAGCCSTSHGGTCDRPSSLSSHRGLARTQEECHSLTSVLFELILCVVEGLSACSRYKSPEVVLECWAEPLFSTVG